MDSCFSVSIALGVDGMAADEPADDANVRPTRCAIYSRKSTEEGLAQEFNSLDAQREAAEAYILSQRQLGWTVVPDHYDDGGFTGGNMERPALHRLLADIEARRSPQKIKAERAALPGQVFDGVPSARQDDEQDDCQQHDLEDNSP